MSQTSQNFYRFTSKEIDFTSLRQRAFNFRWAEQAEEIIPLTAADPDFSTAPPIREALLTYLSQGPLSYGPTAGLPSFRDAVASDLKQGGVDASASQVLATDGAASAMFLVAKSILKPGDEALIFDPVDFLFARSVLAAGARPIRVPFTREGGIDLELFERVASRPRVKLLCLCAPHNPFGRILRSEELIRVGQIAHKRKLAIMSDEVWQKISYEQPQIHTASLPNLAPLTYTVSGFSKCFGLAGLRIGYIHAPTQQAYQHLLERSHAGDTAFGASTLSQIAAEAGLRDKSGWLDAWLAHLNQARTLTCSRLAQLEGLHCLVPEATYLASPYLDPTAISMRGFNSEKLTQFILERAQVALVPGSPRFFGAGAQGLVRVCFATSLELLDEALTRIEKVWDERQQWLSRQDT